MNGGLQRLLDELDATERAARRETPLHRIDARAKTLVTLIYLTALLSLPLQRLSELLLFALYPIAGAAMSDTSYPRLLLRSLSVLPFVLFVGMFDLWLDRTPLFTVGTMTVTRGAIRFCSIVARGLLSFQALSLLIRTTGSLELCRALQRLGAPPLFTAQLLFVLRYIRLLVEEALTMSRARAARSLGRSSRTLRLWAMLVGQLLIRSFDRAERIDRAMTARGFAGRIPPSPFDRMIWRRRDTCYLLGWSTALLLLRALGPAERLFR